MPRPPQGPITPATETPSPITTAIVRAPGSEAAAQIFATLAYGEAPRVGILGDTGSGKTHAERLLIDEYLRRSVGFAVVVDDKDPRRAQFAGQVREDQIDLIGNPPDPTGPRVIVLRGDIARGGDLEPDQIAAYAWHAAGMGRPVLVVFDELNHVNLTTYGQWCRGIEWAPRCFAKGRSVGVAVMWGTQSPQDCPRIAFEQSSAIATFKLAGMGLRKLGELDYLSGGAADVIPRLTGEPAAPAARGDFVLLRRGQVWDRKIYKF